MFKTDTENNNLYPEYYGDIQPWAKIMKAIVSGISIIVFLITLFSENHDVRGFFSSLLLSSSPVFVDLLVIFNSLFVEKRLKTNPIFIIAFVCSIFCFASSLAILILDGRKITFIDAFMNGSYWGLALIFFVPIIFSFVINTLQPLKFTDTKIKTEPRN